MIELSEHTALVTEKICRDLNEPFDLAAHQVSVLASKGIAHCPLHGDNERQLLRHAEEAMYAAKKGLDARCGVSNDATSNLPKPRTVDN